MLARVDSGVGPGSEAARRNPPIRSREDGSRARAPEAAPKPRSAQIARTSRTGRKIIAPTSSSTPPTAIPTIRNGISKSQTIGYATSASNARGQQRIRRMHHNRNLIIALVQPLPPTHTLKGTGRFPDPVPMLLPFGL